MAIDRCHCGRSGGFDSCCGPVIDGTRPAATAEALMRSRFTAFAIGDRGHLLESWAPEARPRELRLDADRRWTRLEILDIIDGRELSASGVVEFRAHYELDGVAGSVHERSTFRRERGRWVYVDGVSAD